VRESVLKLSTSACACGQESTRWRGLELGSEGDGVGDGGHKHGRGRVEEAVVQILKGTVADGSKSAHGRLVREGPGLGEGGCSFGAGDEDTEFTLSPEKRARELRGVRVRAHVRNQRKLNACHGALLERMS